MFEVVLVDVVVIAVEEIHGGDGAVVSAKAVEERFFCVVEGLFQFVGFAPELLLQLPDFVDLVVDFLQGHPFLILYQDLLVAGI